MKVLRAGGEFADRLIRRRGKKAILCFICFIGICFVFFFVSYKLIALLGLVLAFGHLATAYDQWEHWFLGKRGELAVTRAVAALPDQYVLLNDLMLPNGRGNVDHFLIGPNGLFVIETKNYAANVKCYGDRWFVNGKRAHSLSRQVKGNALTIRSNLQKVFTEHRARLPFVEPIVTFVKHTHRLDLHEPTVHVLKAEELVGFIRAYERHSRFARFSPELIQAMVDRLQCLHDDKISVTHDCEQQPSNAAAAQF
jgi:hypothetical protein